MKCKLGSGARDLLLEGLTLGALYNLYNEFTGAAEEYREKERRIRAAYNKLLPESDSFHDQRTLMDGIAEDYTSGKWKGASRNLFDQKIDDLMGNMKPCDTKLNNYCDKLNWAAQAANRKSGDYIPLYSEVWTAIQNFTN